LKYSIAKNKYFFYVYEVMFLVYKFVVLICIYLKKKYCYHYKNFLNFNMPHDNVENLLTCLVMIEI